MTNLICTNAGAIPLDDGTNSFYKDKDLKELNVYTCNGFVYFNKQGKSTYFIKEINDYKLCERFEICDNFGQTTLDYIKQLILKENKTF